jgi:large subunit ribosomal protein L13
MAKKNWYIVDAANLIMGRLCSQIAKKLLYGKNIVIINAKDGVISGRRNQVLEKYVHLRHIRTLSNPRRGPFHSSRPDTFLRQKMKFMLPKNIRGREAYQRVQVFIAGIPNAKKEQFGKMEALIIKKASSDRLSRKFVTIADVCMNMGWTGGSRDHISSMD